MNWISVNDGLPGFEVPVLITDGIKISMVYRDLQSDGRVFCITEGCHSNDSCWPDVDEEKITHWMPLPELPKIL